MFLKSLALLSAQDDLSGKVILVTGGSRGIGASIVTRLYESGADVILHYNKNAQKAEALVKDFDKARIHLVQSDFSQREGANELWQKALAWKGRVDVLVNNAGVLIPSPIDDPVAWQDAWEKTMRVNLFSAADLSRSLVEHARHQKVGGIIINISSVSAHHGFIPEYSAYAASKAGMNVLTKAITRMHAAENILTYTIAPGMIPSDMVKTFAGGDLKAYSEKKAQSIPLGEVGTPEEIGDIVAKLSTGQWRYTTGSTIDTNGGSLMP